MLSGNEAVLVTGPGADDPAVQFGGWTVGWLGVSDDRRIPETTTALAGIERVVGGTVEHVPWELKRGMRRPAPDTPPTSTIVATRP